MYVVKKPANPENWREELFILHYIVCNQKAEQDLHNTKQASDECIYLVLTLTTPEVS